MERALFERRFFCVFQQGRTFQHQGQEYIIRARNPRALGLGVNHITEHTTTRITESFRPERGDSTQKELSGDPADRGCPSTRGRLLNP